MENAEIGIIGGTGIYDPGLLEDSKELSIETPYGAPSEKITVGQYNGKKVAFIPRHGKKHTILPHMINYRANIWALKELGVKRIVSPSAVGSLKEDLPPGSFVLPSQFVDFTKTRNGSFSKIGDVFHISTADPFCPQMEDVILEAAKKTGLKMHTGKSYVCIEGPRFSTRAESNFFRTAVNADIIGMNATFLPLYCPTVIFSDGAPYGVSMESSLLSSSNPGSYIPVPPIIPISAFSI